ncbi:MAG TPA: RluA family pseudouridine synthase [Longimicrobiales bacterium]|nr:RluA family pseudouridine synthase [Longimicrobiales bacterium]
MDSTRRLDVPAEAAGERIDAHIAARLPDLSRSRVAQLIADGRVRLNGAVPRKSERVAAGDVVEVEVPPPEPSAVEPEAIPLDIIYEDRDLLVVNKPAGLVVHPAPGHRSGTLVNALLHHVTDLSGIGGVRRPGIVHRLDKDTSGLMIVAKHDRAHRRLAAALRRRDIRRDYLAACWGHLDADRQTVDAPIRRSPRDRKKMAVLEDGRRAVTHFRRVERWRAADLLEATLETGRTHQIRVHLAHIGHPVVGDPVYGGGGARGMSGTGRAWARELEARVPRQFLHARRLVFEHPRTKAAMELEAPLPPDLAAAADWAAGTSAR